MNARDVVLWALGALVLLYLLAMEIVDMAGRLEYIDTHFPRIIKWAERKAWHRVLLLIALSLLGINTYQLANEYKESPPLIAKFPQQPAPTVGSPDPPKVIVKTLPAPEIKKQCWTASHFWFPRSDLEKGAVTATTVILHCNYKVDAPFRVAIEFDRDFIPARPSPLSLPDAPVASFRGGQDGRVLFGEVGMTSLPAGQLVLATVYGDTNQNPKPLRSVIQTVQ